MKTDIEAIAEEKAKEIAKIIIKKYKDAELEDGTTVEEIYERTLHQATGFLLDNNIDNEAIEILESHAKARLANPQDIKKMTNKELLALMISTYIKNFIYEWKEILIEY